MAELLTAKGNKRYPPQIQQGFPFSTGCCERCGQRVYIKGGEKRILCHRDLDAIIDVPALTEEWYELGPIQEVT